MNCETRASAVTIFSREGSAVRLDDAARNGEPHSSPLRFCGKECLEKLLDHSTGKTRTRITHADENVSVSITARPNDKSSRIWAHIGHCFEGVDGEIEKDLQDLHRISPNPARIGINFSCHFYLPSNGISVDNTEQLANGVSDLDQRAARLAFADHVADALNNFAGPAAVSHDVGERRRQFAHHRDASHPGQFHVLELMLQLRLLARGNVDNRCQNKQTLPGADRIESHFDWEFAAVFSTAKKIAPGSHGAAAGFGEKTFAIADMSIAETFWNQRFDMAADQLAE